MLSVRYLVVMPSRNGIPMIWIFRWSNPERLGGFEYEGQGEITLREGSSVLQPPGIKHREVTHSDDLN